MKLKNITLKLPQLSLFILMLLLNAACGGASSAPAASSSANKEAALQDTGSMPNQTAADNNTAVSNNEEGFHYEVQDVNYFQDGDRLRVYANVANTGRDTFIGTRYTLSLLDAGGNIVATDHLQTQTDIVPPGKTSPIWFTLDDPPVWDSYEIVVRDQGMRFGDFAGEIVDISVTPMTGSGTCGEFTVLNNDNIPTSFLFIAERHLDGNGRMIDVYVTGVNTNILQPGESVTGHCFADKGPYELTAVAWHITD